MNPTQRKPDRVRWKRPDGQVVDIAVVPDPGPGTYQETADGMRELFRLATLKIRAATEALHDAPPGDIDGVSPQQGALSAASAEWKHARNNLARYEAFLRVHPEMAGQLITVDCGHVRAGRLGRACEVAGDEGWYRTPEGTHAPMLEREAGADDDDEMPISAAGGWCP